MIWQEWNLPNFSAPNRIVRSATYEGLGDRDGNPKIELADVYSKLAANKVGTIITGFCYVSPEGKAMQPAQCGIETDERILPWSKVVNKVRGVNSKTKLIMQIAHTGRQTTSEAIGQRPLAPSKGSSKYFRSNPRQLDNSETERIISDFAAAAYRAKKAGFDGVQIHAAHGYLIHQFLSPSLNRRKDLWGKDLFTFLERILERTRATCGDSFPVFLKVSGADDDRNGMTPDLTIEYLNRARKLGVVAAEISYGTMDKAMNIFRGGLPIKMVLEHNPLFKNYPEIIKILWTRFLLPRWKKGFHKFSEDYNMDICKVIRANTEIPLFLVGGIRTKISMRRILTENVADAVSLCRPLIFDPCFARKIFEKAVKKSGCTNCNACAIMCDSTNSLRCYSNNWGNNE